MNSDSEPSLRGQYASFTSHAIAFLVDLGIVNVVVAIATTVFVLFMRYFNYGQLFFTNVSDEPTTLAVIVTGLTAVGTTLLCISAMSSSSG